jgi:putative peptidoglycan lipid II flippase
MGALHQRGAFFITSASPVFFNVFNILGALLFSEWLERYGPAWIDVAIAPRRITGFAIGVLCGGAAQLLLQVVGATKELKAALGEYRWHIPWSSDLRSVLILMGPMALAASAGQIRTVINNYFATTAGSSAVVWLDSSFRLLQLPIGLFGVAISSAVLPPLAKAIGAAGGKVDRLASRQMQHAIEMVTWLMAPCLAFYAVNSLDVVRCLLQSGHFGAEDAHQTARALFAYSFALPGYGLSKVMTSFFFALERTRYALAVSLITIAANTSMNWYLVSHFGHTGLAWGYALTQTLSIALFVYGMRGQGIQVEWRPFARSMLLLGGAVLLSLGVMSLVAHLWDLGSFLKTGSPLLDSGALLLVNGLLCVSIFGGLAMFYLKLTPRSAWSKLRRRRRSG